uniref:Uncharacterized protein n=1 Tax=Anopheles atroparvus TaxID=41427 RepID=A0AAG5CQ97_ANOAO
CALVEQRIYRQLIRALALSRRVPSHTLAHQSTHTPHHPGRRLRAFPFSCARPAKKTVRTGAGESKGKVSFDWMKTKAGFRLVFPLLGNGKRPNRDAGRAKRMT